MTHFNSFSFPMHFAIDIVALIWLWLISKFFGYQWSYSLIHKRNLQFWCYTLLWAHCWFWLFYDFTAVLGAFYFSPSLPGGMGLLNEEETRKFFFLSNALFDVVIVTHTALLFLLISFFHTLFKNDVAEQFVKKWEFKAFFVYAILSVLAYPLTQWPFLNHGDPLLIVVIPQYIYSGELIFSSILFLIVVFRMKRVLSNMELQRSAPMLKLLIRLIYLLIFWDMGLSISFLIINISLQAAGSEERAREALTLGFLEFCQSIFLINMLCVVWTIAFMLNVGKLTRLVSGKSFGETTVGATEMTHTAGTSNTSHSKSSTAPV